jgi:ATP-dependent Clp protease, protease subunit
MFRLEEEKETKEVEKIKLFDSKIDETLLKARRIFFCKTVDMESAKEAIRQLWYLELVAPGTSILFVINSPGGSIDAGFAIWDQIKMITSPVTTLVTGLAASMGSVLSLCAAPGCRFATEHARIMIHQPSIGGIFQGQVTDLAIQAEEMKKTREALVALYVKATGRSTSVIEQAIDRDKWFCAKEALEFGLLDKIVSSFKEIK